MNKKLIFIFTLALAVFLMIGAVSAGWLDFLGGGASDSNDDETFVVGVHGNFPPFLYKGNDSEYTGFDIELAKEVARRNNWTFKVVPIIDWDSKEFEVNSGEVDCIWSELSIDGRENDFTWSKPYYNNSQVVVVRSNSSINSLDDLDGKVVEVLASGSASKALNGDNKTLKDRFAKVNEVNDDDSAFLDLKSGVCDAVICDSGYANYQIKNKYSDSSFKILNESVSSDSYGVGFKKGNTGLRDKVQKTLDEMYADGTVDRIAQNYSDYKIPDGVIHP